VISEASLAQKILHTKCPSKPTSRTPPTPQTQNRKLPVNFGELISFLSIPGSLNGAWTSGREPAKMNRKIDVVPPIHQAFLGWLAGRTQGVAHATRPRPSRLDCMQCFMYGNRSVLRLSSSFSYRFPPKAGLSRLPGYTLSPCRPRRYGDGRSCMAARTNRGG
jgi:hypothetical protein